METERLAATAQVAIPLSVYPEPLVNMALMGLEPDFVPAAISRNADSLLVTLTTSSLHLTEEQVAWVLRRQLLITAVQRRARSEGADLAALFASSAASIGSSGRNFISGLRKDGPERPGENQTSTDASPNPALFSGCRLRFRDPSAGSAQYELNNRQYVLPTILRIADKLRRSGDVRVIPLHRTYQVNLLAQTSDQLSFMEAQLLCDLKEAVLEGVPNAPEVE